MAATLARRSNISLLSRLKALPNLMFQFRVQRLKHKLPGQQNTQLEVYFKDLADMSKWKTMDAMQLGITHQMIPPPPWNVLNLLHKEGFQVYLVGGCVRDLVLKRVPKDFDVITTASLKQVNEKFNNCTIVGRRLPVCRVRVEKTIIEVTSFETVAQHKKENEKVLISQMPSGCDESDFIRWKNSMHRDFTINSLFYDPFVNKIYDYANGMADLRDLKLRTVIPAQVSFMEDCALILRAIRITARLGLSFSKDMDIALQNLSSSIKTVNKMRLMMELNTMFSCGAAEHSLHLLQKVRILEFLFPYHAEYLDQQGTEKSSLESTMLMKLFSNLDKLVACDRPCHSSVWVGLLAFHLALVNNPQDTLVIRTFASVLYLGKWKEGAQFARKQAQVEVNSAPEISDSSNYESDEELAVGVKNLALLVKKSIADLTKADNRVEVTSEFPDSPQPPSHLGLIRKEMSGKVAGIFKVLLGKITSYESGRKSFDIDYCSLGEGSVCEARLVVGKVILKTMNVNEHPNEKCITRQENVGKEKQKMRRQKNKQRAVLKNRRREVMQKLSENIIYGKAKDKNMGAHPWGHEKETEDSDTKVGQYSDVEYRSEEAVN